MNQQPWISSTRNDATSDETIEVRYPTALLSVITMALIFGGIVTCGLMWFLSGQQPASEQNLVRAVGTVVLLVDIGAAIFLRSFLGNTFVRTDDKGVTQRNGFGREQFVSWDKIARVETQQTAGIVSGFTLFDASNNAIMKVRPESRPPLDKAKLVAFIEKRLSGHGKPSV